MEAILKLFGGHFEVRKVCFEDIYNFLTILRAKNCERLSEFLQLNCKKLAKLRVFP